MVQGVDRDAFDRIMGLMIGLRFVPGSMDTHWEALKEVPEQVLREAARRAARTRNEFPTPYELRLDCDAVNHAIIEGKQQHDRSVELDEAMVIQTPSSLGGITQVPGIKLPAITRVWKYFCEECNDSGWRERWCGSEATPFDMDRYDCTRRNEHEPHSWVEHCPCVPRNPDIQRRIAAQARYAEVRAEKGSGYRAS